MVKIAGVIFFTRFINTKIVAISRCSGRAGIAKCSIMYHSGIISGIAIKAIAAKYLAKYMAIVGGHTLYTLVFAGVTFFATCTIQHHSKNRSYKKQFLHEHGFTTVKIKTHLMVASLQRTLKRGFPHPFWVFKKQRQF